MINFPCRAREAPRMKSTEAADAAVNPVPAIGGADQSGKIDLHGLMDGNHRIVLADDVGVVGVGHRMEFHKGIQVHEIEQFAAAQAVGGDGLFAVDFFFFGW